MSRLTTKQRRSRSRNRTYPPSMLAFYVPGLGGMEWECYRAPWTRPLDPDPYTPHYEAGSLGGALVASADLSRYEFKGARPVVVSYTLTIPA
jgi:hypothetical protein